jgi:hypothetical protein
MITSSIPVAIAQSGEDGGGEDDDGDGGEDDNTEVDEEDKQADVMIEADDARER